MYKTIDLFAGAGGLSYGFEMTNKFQIVAAVEKNKNAKETYISNHKGKDNIEIIDDVVGYDFAELDKRMGGIDVVIGGPPCQGFSNANRQKNHIISMNNSLVKEYFRAVLEIKPKAFVMENVSMLASETHRFYDSYIDHEMVERLGVKMKKEELVIAKKSYDSLRVCDILQQGDQQYEISPVLFQLLNVLNKNRNNNDKLKNYIQKNKKKIYNEIQIHINSHKYCFCILNDIYNNLDCDDIKAIIKELSEFLSFQKALILKKELDNNQIIYALREKENSDKVIAEVKTYSIIEYVKNIVAEEYEQCGGVVNSLWFGVPQDRKRYIVFGVRKDWLGIRTLKPLCQPSNFDLVSVNDAILDLANCKTTDEVSDEPTSYADVKNISDYARKMRVDSNQLHNNIIPRTGDDARQRFAQLEEGQNFHDLDDNFKSNYTDPARTQNSIYLRLDGKKPSGTVVNVRKSMWIHPKLNRAISVREAARLQSFPDKFIFRGTKDSQYQQIGNAVPPLMAQGVAEWLDRYLTE